MQKYKRNYPRINKRVPVLLRPPAGDALYSETQNLSRGGFQIDCDRVLVTTLCPNFDDESTDIEGEQIKVELTLSAAAAKNRIVAVYCKPVFAQRASTNAYRLGCEFTTVDNHSMDELADFIDECLGQEYDYSQRVS